MLLEAKGVPMAGWALVGKNNAVILSDVCGSERQALELRKKQMIHQPQRGALSVVPVVITVTVVDR